MTGVLLQAVEWPRLIGSATRDAGDVVFKCTGIDSTRIFDDAPQPLWVQFGHLKTPDAVVAFVNDFGPVLDLPADFFLAEENQTKALSQFDTPREIRESIADVLEEARTFGMFLGLVINSNRAAEGDKPAKKKIDEHLELVRKRFAQVFEKYREHITPEMHLTADLSSQLQIHLDGSRPVVRSTAPGRFEVRLLSRSLLSSCYLQAAQTIGSRTEIRQCLECQRVFVPRDPRMLDCESKCGQRRRKRERANGATRQK